MIIYLVVILILFSSIFIVHSFIKSQKQKELYSKALNFAKNNNKKLLVIGNPGESNTNYFFGKYGCGNICIDITGCDCDTSSVTIIKNKLENELQNFEDNSVVIFESEVLEYIDNNKIDKVIQEMYRISNKNIYSVHELKPYSLLTKIKQLGYMTFNKIMNRQVFECKRLFITYPPEGDYKYVDF